MTAVKSRALAAAAICSLAAFLSLVPGAAAIGSLDQSDFAATAGGGPIVDSGDTVAQTFTAGISGPLTDVSVELELTLNPASAPLEVDIVPVSSGTPVLGTVLGTGTILASAVSSSYQLLNVHLTTAATVVSGTQYALVLSTTAGFLNSYVWEQDSTDSYPGGTIWSTASSASDDLEFATYVTLPDSNSAGPAPRGGYCTAAGDTTDAGATLAPGTFVNLDDGQAWTDTHYAGSTPANFVQGLGLTCAPPPAGYTRRGFATADMNVDANTYPYYATA